MRSVVKNFSYILLFFILAVFWVSQQALAQSIALDLEKIKPLTPVQYMPDEEFESATELIDDTPYDDEFLSYQVRLPKGWQKNMTASNVLKTNETGLSQNVLGIVTRYISPPKKHLRSSFSVEAIELIHEIGARNWFIQYILKSGLSLEQVGLESNQKVEALYIEVEGDSTRVVRVKSIINGPRMVIARYSVPVELYNEERVQQAQVIRSFDLTNRQEVPIEDFEIHGFLGQSFFDYPVSWALSAPKVRSINRMRAMLYHGAGKSQLAGQINLYLTNKSLETTRSEELKFYQDKFKIEDYTLEKLIASPEMTYYPDMHFGVTQVYSMKSENVQKIDYELWVSVLENDHYIYVTSLLTPSRSEDFYKWARNTEAYALVVRSVRRDDKSINVYDFIQ